MHHPELMARIETLRKAFDILVPREIERLIAEGTLLESARTADQTVQASLVVYQSAEMRWLDNQIHNLNVEWNIAEGLY